MAVLKIQSCPVGFDAFSESDDESDRALLGGLSRWTDEQTHHLSAYMLSNGAIRGRLVGTGEAMPMVERVMVVGDVIMTFAASEETELFSEADLRIRQAFGNGTTKLVKSLCVGVEGRSGTGRWVDEMLARLESARSSWSIPIG